MDPFTHPVYVKGWGPSSRCFRSGNGNKGTGLTRNGNRHKSGPALTVYRSERTEPTNRRTRCLYRTIYPLPYRGRYKNHRTRDSSKRSMVVKTRSRG